MTSVQPDTIVFHIRLIQRTIGRNALRTESFYLLRMRAAGASVENHLLASKTDGALERGHLLVESQRDGALRAR